MLLMYICMLCIYGAYKRVRTYMHARNSRTIQVRKRTHPCGMYDMYEPKVWK